MGLPVDRVTQAEVMFHIVSSFKAGTGGWIATVNVDILKRSLESDKWTALLSAADVVVPDGMPLVWASRLMADPLPERVAGSELLFNLSSTAAVHDVPIFLLGGAAGVAGHAARTLQLLFPDLRVLGTAAPTLHLDNLQTEVETVASRLRDADPAIVFCAFGFPKQEMLMAELSPRLPAHWFIGVGGAFTMASGLTPAAPRWMRAHGLEWLHRFRLEPARLFRRYFLDDIPFGLRLLVNSVLRRYPVEPASAHLDFERLFWPLESEVSPNGTPTADGASPLSGLAVHQ